MGQMVVGSGYTLHYLDEETGEHVSMPLVDRQVSLSQLEGRRALVVHDGTSLNGDDVERAVRRVFAKPDLDNLSPYTPLEKRRPDWQDRGPKHNNRKKRSWRR